MLSISCTCILVYVYHVHFQVKCGGNENDVTSCLVEEVCQTQQYASVVCYGFVLTTGKYMCL